MSLFGLSHSSTIPGAADPAAPATGDSAAMNAANGDTKHNQAPLNNALALVARPAPTVPSRAAADVGAAIVDTQAAQLGVDLVAARRQGLFGLLRWRFEAWIEDRMKDATIRKLTVRREVLEAQQKTTEAEIKLSSVVKSGQKDVERHQIEWNQLRRDRLVSDLERYSTAIAAASGTLPPAAMGAGAAPPSAAGANGAPARPVSVHITDEQIEQLALRTFVNLGPAGENEDEWASYKADLREHLPPYVAQEVERQVEKLRRQAAH